MGDKQFKIVMKIKDIQFLHKWLPFKDTSHFGFQFMKNGLYHRDNNNISYANKVDGKLIYIKTITIKEHKGKTYKGERLSSIKQDLLKELKIID